MDFTFEEEQRLAAQSLRELLDDHCTGADLRRAAEAREPQAFLAACASRRAKLAELGLAGALVPAAQGGLGLAPIDFVLLAEEAGRAALPEPLIDGEGVAHPLLAALAAQDAAAAPVLEAVLEGSATAPLVLCAWPDAPAVAWAPFADFVLTGKDFDVLELHRAADLVIEPVASVDPLRRCGVVRARAAQPLAVLRGDAARTAWSVAKLRQDVFVAAQLLGLATRMTEIAVAYALERKQFGRAIGSNQSIKHQLADVQIRSEFARPVLHAAAAELRALRVSHAVVAAGDAADRAARTAIQIHGAMGYSWELDLQFYAKRAWALIGLGAGRAGHLRRIHGALRDGSAALGPDALFADQSSAAEQS